MYRYNTDYYTQDIQAGDRCFFDNLDVYKAFNADLIKFSTSPGEVENEYRNNTGKSGFLALSAQKENVKAKIQFYVGGKSVEEMQLNATGLIAAGNTCVIRMDSSRFEYPAILDEYDTEETGIDTYTLVTLTMGVVVRYPLMSINLTGPKTVMNPGKVESGIRFEIRPTSALSTFKINGITIKNLKANETFVIDGIDGRVTANEINRFQDTDIIDFPKIVPGKNEITMSNNVPVTVSFYPVFQ